MDPLSKVLLGVVALSALVQALVMLALALAGRRLFRAQVGKDLTRVLGEVERIAHHVAEISDTVAVQGRRVDEAVAVTTATVRDTADYLGRAARKSVVPLLEIGALWQGAKRAIQVYRRLRPPSSVVGAPPPGLEIAGPHEVWTERQAGESHLG